MSDADGRGLRAKVPFASERSSLMGIVLQSALRVLLVAFIGITLVFEPPNSRQEVCFAVLGAYVVVVTLWCVTALRPAARTDAIGGRTLALLMLGADLTVVAVLSVLTGVASPSSWTSDVLSTGLFLIPLIAAAQLDPYVSGVIAVPTLATYLAVSWIDQSPNGEPWSSILLRLLVLSGLAAGSVALSMIQRKKVEAIEELAVQRSQLLEELLNLEKQERQALSERLHDGALQYVIVARQDLDDARAGSHDAAERADSALLECSRLLRDVVRELHPAVLASAGLPAALAALADGIGSRSGMTVHFDASGWPDAGPTAADGLLYGAAREITTNAVKHARAKNLWIELGRSGAETRLLISDDGVGVDPGALAHSLEAGHIGMASTRAKVQAAGGTFAVRPTTPGTEVEISLPAA